MILVRSGPFVEMYLALPPQIRKKVDRQLLYLANNLYHPSLRARKMAGFVDIWEARVDEHYRMTFQVTSEVIVLRKVGTHKIYRKP